MNHTKPNLVEGRAANHLFIVWWGVLVAAGIASLLGNYLVLGPTEIDFLLSVRSAVDYITDSENYQLYMTESFSNRNTSVKDTLVIASLENFVTELKNHRPASQIIEEHALRLDNYAVSRRYDLERIRQIFKDWLQSYSLSTELGKPRFLDWEIHDTAGIREIRGNALSIIYENFGNRVLDSKTCLVMMRYIIGIILLAFVLKDLFYYYHLQDYSTIFRGTTTNEGQNLRFVGILIFILLLIIPIVQATILSIPPNKLQMIYRPLFLLFLLYFIIDSAEIYKYIRQTKQMCRNDPVLKRLLRWLYLDLFGLGGTILLFNLLKPDPGKYVWETSICNYWLMTISLFVLAFIVIVSFFIIFFTANGKSALVTGT